MPWSGAKLLVMNVTLEELPEAIGVSVTVRASVTWPSPLEMTSA